MTAPLITIEGLDGSGKTTVATALADHFDAHQTQEPSELWTGKQARRAINNDSDDVHPLTTFFLFVADRSHHIEQVIRPRLADGQMVVCDRYADSTRAYQPVALADHVAEPRTFIRQATAEWTREPDLTLFVDTPIDECLARMDGTEEYEERAFLEQVQTNYDAVMKGNNHRVTYLDGTQSKADVRTDAIDAVAAYQTDDYREDDR